MIQQTMRNTAERKKRKQPTELSDTAIEGFLRDAFEANYARLRYETGHALSLELKEAAWQQIHLYWQRLHNLARRVTETEVRLVLPNQKTPNGRTFGIEGVVDIVQEDGRTVMYDLKPTMPTSFEPICPIMHNS